MAPPRPVPEYIGLAGVVLITEAPRNTVDSWKRRGKLPPPDATGDGHALWFPSTIHEWWDSVQGSEPVTD